MDTTPMLKQYYEIKEKYRDEILFFRLGDFYEMFNDDAKIASKILNITLTARHKGSEHETPMCGIPFHAVDNYVYKLTKAGKRVAICEQTSDPSLPGIVKREVIRVVTPGTTLDDNVVENKKNNFLVSLILQNNIWGFALGDLTTGEFKVTQIDNFELLKNELSRLSPSEVIVPSGLFNDTRYQDFLNTLPNLNIYQLPAYETADRVLTTHFKVKTFSGFGLAELPIGLKAAGALLGYLKETQKTNLEHVLTMSRYALENFMILDQATLRNLEIFQNAWTGAKQGSLLEILDYTQTAGGGRTLRQWLLLPLVNVPQIKQRLDAVEEIYNDSILIGNLCEQFKEISDIERLLGKIGCNRAGARDFIALKNSLKVIPKIKELLRNRKAALLGSYYENLKELNEAVKIIENTLIDEPPLSLTEGGFIKSGFSKELDELRQISTGGKDWLRELQVKEAGRTKINSLKIKFNKIFGYYIEISKANLSAVPQDYIRKQTLVNAERYITPELKEFEEKILGAEEKIGRMEYQMFLELREKIVAFFKDMQTDAKLLGALDCLMTFAVLAKKNNYVKPTIGEDGVIDVKNSRHPVIEKFQANYVPNDLLMDHKKNELILLTGPNMSGKSSYLRQVALIVLMTQIGCFAPAEKAVISAVDRIFTRVGASDNVAQGVSTFMNEMLEAANILNNATSKSLIILDELGRGTSTYDGVSIAWAMIEHLHEKIKAKTLFATHYHELVEIIKKLPRAANYCVAVSEDQGKVVFLHKIIKGAANQSYGIEVAKLAGLPISLTDRATELLIGLEAKSRFNVVNRPKQGALTLPAREEKLSKALAVIDVNNLTPIEALQKLAEIKRLDEPKA
jgi:DNA mismatch repair protein MutS